MVKRVLLGKFPDGGYGLRISDAGYDVTSNPVDNERLTFNSDWPAVLPIYVMGTASVNNSLTSIYYADLGYTPHCAALVNINGQGLHQFSTSNTLRFRANNAAPLRQYVFEGGALDNIAITAYNSQLNIYSNMSVSITYIVYRMRAF